MYQDTDFGKEVLDGVQMQADKLKIKIVETVTHKPTDQDFTAQITKLKGAAAISWRWAPSCATRSCRTRPRARSAGPTSTSSARRPPTTCSWRPRRAA
jgi:hypothetical protein